MGPHGRIGASSRCVREAADGRLRDPLVGLPESARAYTRSRCTGLELAVDPLEAIDGTPVVDIKPVL